MLTRIKRLLKGRSLFPCEIATEASSDGEIRRVTVNGHDIPNVLSVSAEPGDDGQAVVTIQVRPTESRITIVN